MAQINNVFLRRDGANNATGESNMNGYKVVNIDSPSAAGDAATASPGSQHCVATLKIRKEPN
jgi:hypothetical protein